MNDDFDFEDDGELRTPTMRGNANLDPQDYSRGPSGRGSSILDDELQEDTFSTPGRNPGAASAPDIDGTSSWTISEDDDGPGMDQTTYGAHPWGPSAGAGYRPHSMARTDQALRDSNLGDVNTDPIRSPKTMKRDDMHSEPEVLHSDDATEVQEARWSGNRNQRPSNVGIPEDTEYDRESFEYDDSSQNVIGTGIFGMEEGVTWRPRDGSFAHQYALPAYIGDEDEMGIQQSDMWDTTANEWRVTQPSGGGVPFARSVNSYKPTEMRPETTGPRSHIEAFGRETAKAIIAEAQSTPPVARAAVIERALTALQPGSAAKVASTAKFLVDGGQAPQAALEDTIAHVVMNAAARDLRSGKCVRLDRLAAVSRHAKPRMQLSAAKHLGPLLKNKKSLHADMAALVASPALQGMGQVDVGQTTSVFTPRNLIIAGVLGVGGYYAWTHRKSIARNARRMARKVGI